jgi:PAS domain S-box-containing protein
MRLKTKLVVAITGLVFLVVGLLSMLYLSQLLRQSISQSYDSNELAAHQILFGTRQALAMGMKNRQVDVNNPDQLRSAVADTLRQDENLQSLMDSVLRYSQTVFDISIADSNDRALASTDPTMLDQILPSRPDYRSLRSGSLYALLTAVFGPPKVYNVVLPIERNGRPFATIYVGIRTTFLRSTFAPRFLAALTLSGIAMCTSLLVAAFLANLALQPLEVIGARLDALASVEAGTVGELEPPRSTDAVIRVSNKIERLGRRMRNVEEVFSALKENLDQIMSNLQDGIVLFTRDRRAVLVSNAVERVLGIPRQDILGAEVHEVFDRATVLGRTIRQAFDGELSLVQEEIETETGRRIEVSLDFIHEEPDSTSLNGLGALLTLHDLESVKEIENELELSRRLAAIGRLTSGVGHEVKNPINAIVVHLELLKNKISAEDSSKALRHLDVIQSEIQRLDRVVQTLVDFSRPVELQLKEQDLRQIISSVMALASADLETRNVTVHTDLPDHPIIAKVDADLLRQAVLNVVLNGAQAMQGGGPLRVDLMEESRMALIAIRDSGDGIPDEIQQKIFNLYFTTKKEGSGIGLAMTYRVVQLHNGSIDVQSKVGQGTTFTLRIPLNHSFDLRVKGYLGERMTQSEESS